MTSIRYTLLADGTSDQMLDSIIRWMLGRRRVDIDAAALADFSSLRDPPRTLDARVRVALKLYPCDVLFVHRDAESADLQTRVQEIRRAVRHIDCPHVAVVPIRMTEAWFLHDEQAIRLASGNPSGTAPLDLPPVRRLEDLPDPKEVLMRALEQAADVRGRRSSRVRRELPRMRLRVAELCGGFDCLVGLTAFDALQREVDTALARLP